VDVVVTDKQGKPVTGLHPEDFVVEESGKRQKISTLSNVITPQLQHRLCRQAFTRIKPHSGRLAVLSSSFCSMR
jgi:hypothetical protein